MRTCRTLALLVLLAGPSACSNSQFAGLGNRSKTEKDEDSGEIKDGKKTSQSNKKEDEQDLDDPQQVAGSFLTLECIEDDGGPHDDQNVTVGCVVKDRDGQKVDMTNATDQQWHLVSPLNFPVTTSFNEEPSDSPFHRKMLTPKSLLVFHSVQATFVKDGLDRDLVDFINVSADANGELPSPPPELPIVEVGQSEDFQLGDDNFSSGSNSGCRDRLQAVSISGHSITAVLHVKSASAKVGISLRDVCGVSYKTNGAALFKDGSKIVAGDIKQYANDLALPGVELQQGVYQLVVESRFSSGEGSDRDDFVVGKIVVASDGEVALDRPTVPGVAEPVTEPVAEEPVGTDPPVTDPPPETVP